jgi:ATP-dependent Lhr-like helicase
LDELTSTGEVTWTGCGTLAGGDGWVALSPTDIADLLLPEVAAEPPDTPVHRAVLAVLDGGALFFRQLVDRAGTVLLESDEQPPDDPTVVTAVWDLVWAGLISNDTLAPLRTVGAHGPDRRCRRAPDRPPLRAAGSWWWPGRPIRRDARMPAPRRSSNDTVS